MQRYDVVLDLSRKGELLQVVTDIDGDGYLFNHEKGTFHSIFDWDFLNTVQNLLLSLTDDDFVWDMDYDLIEKLYEDAEGDVEDERIFWTMYWDLHLDRFNESIGFASPYKYKA